MAAEVMVEIVNKRGLHARAAAKFVKTAGSYDATVTVIKIGQNGEEDSHGVGGASILGLMMLGADPGSHLRICGEGAQAQDAVGALKALVENKFGEED